MALVVRGLCPLLQAFDMPRSLRFYRDVLGFEIHETASGWLPCVRGACRIMVVSLLVT